MYKGNKWHFSKLKRAPEGVTGQCECGEALRITAVARGLRGPAARHRALRAARGGRRVP